jgi:uncharacterized protein (TIGR03437 family)
MHHVVGAHKQSQHRPRVYLIGMGLTNQSLVSGQGSPTNPLAVVSLTPTVTVDGETVVPFFAGLTPGFVGLFQMNIIVPADARSGALTLTVDARESCRERNKIDCRPLTSSEP